MSRDLVRLDHMGAIATATLSRPPVNAINDEFLHALGDLLRIVEATPDISVLRIRSDQKVFSAGADLALVAKRTEAPEGAAAMMATVRLFHSVYGRLASLPAVTVAELEGSALGGGLELALACDLRIAAPDALLGLPETKVGLLPGAGGTQRLTQLCGAGIANRIILGGELIDGREAEKIGIVQWCFESREFPERAAAIATRIAGRSAEASRAAKRCIRLASASTMAGADAEIESIGQLMRSSSTRERVAAFLGR